MLFLQLPPVHSPSTARPPDPDIRSRSSISSLLPCYFCSSRPSTARPPDPDILSRSSRNLLNENPSIADAFGKKKCALANIEETVFVFLLPTVAVSEKQLTPSDKNRSCVANSSTQKHAALLWLLGTKSTLDRKER